jgi:chemotaxis protein CheY-P-specific phosphatase CheC
MWYRYKVKNFILMKSSLSQYELDIFSEFMNIALANSADSLSSLLGDKVLLTKNSMEIHDSIDDIKQDDTEQEYFVLGTNIMGQMKGSSFLVVSQKAGEIIMDKCFPPSKNDPESRAMQLEAILLEVDNMLAAAVITQFSNILGITMFGNVPYLKKATSAELKDLIRENLEEHKDGEKYLLATNTRLISDLNEDIQPTFYWVLPESFIHALKEHIKTHKNNSLIKNY